MCGGMNIKELPPEIIENIYRIAHKTNFVDVIKEMGETYEYECENQHESIRTYRRAIKLRTFDIEREIGTFIPEVAISEEYLHREQYKIKFVNVMDDNYDPGFWCEFFPTHRLHLHKTLYPKI